jgi:hypothetical protein
MVLPLPIFAPKALKYFGEINEIFANSLEKFISLIFETILA